MSLFVCEWMGRGGLWVREYFRKVVFHSKCIWGINSFMLYIYDMFKYVQNTVLQTYVMSSEHVRVTRALGVSE